MSVAFLRGRCRRGLLACLVSGVALAAGAVDAGAAQVQTTLNTLLPGGTNATGLTLGDKRYTNFTFSASGIPTQGLAEAVNVTLSDDAAPNRHTLRFSTAGDGLVANPGDSIDLVICYDVNVLGTQRINGVGLTFQSTVAPSGGDAAASVVETVQTLDGSILRPGGTSDMEILSVVNDGAGPLEDTNSDFMALNLTRSLRFCKDIVVSSRPGGGYAVISIVDQIVDQVPEPGSIALIGFAGGAMLLRRRRA